MVNTNHSYIPSAGDIIWLNFDPQSGKGIQKRRPVLVVSESLFNKLGFALVCPITSSQNQKNNPFCIEVDLNKTSYINVQQVRSYDWRSRNAEYMQRTSHETLEEAREILSAIAGL